MFLAKPQWMASESAGVTGLVSMSQGPYLASVGTLLAVAIGGLISSLRLQNKG